VLNDLLKLAWPLGPRVTAKCRTSPGGRERHAAGRPRGRRGQATIELALSLPFLIWLIFYTINAYHSLHTSHVAQRYAAMSLYERTANRAKFVIDDRENRVHGREFMAVQYTDVGGGTPRRKIVVGPSDVNTVVGICREPGCTN
jgi:hypothetical protein